MMTAYVESLFGIFTGELILSAEIAAQELTFEEREALCFSAKEHGIEIVFAETADEWGDEA